MSDTILDRALSPEDKSELLDELLGIQVLSDGSLIDCAGFIFHGIDPNVAINFDTLRGIIVYLRSESYLQGIRHNQAAIKSVLGL